MLDILIRSHVCTLFLVVLCTVKLLSQKTSRDIELRFFWIPVVCCFLLVVEDTLETYTALYPSMVFWRTFLSVVGYILRPTAALGLVLVVCPPQKRSFLILVPALLNAAVFLTAFFSPLAFSFDENYSFVRGPLGVTVIIVSGFYMLEILRLSYLRFRDQKKLEKYLLFICVVFCVTAFVVDIDRGGTRINDAILISTVFFYLFLRSHDSRADSLTGLLNRNAFYDDCAVSGRAVSAVASMDMNGLKRINDTHGHEAGDRALLTVTGCIRDAADRDILAYRIGGDEFVLLFFRRDEQAVQKVLDGISAAVAEKGLSVSCGYAMHRKDADIEETLRESDRNMYAAKSDFYRQSGHDRRKR